VSKRIAPNISDALHLLSCTHGNAKVKAARSELLAMMAVRRAAEGIWHAPDSIPWSPKIDKLGKALIRLDRVRERKP
jgi:hypothetical protein